MLPTAKVVMKHREVAVGMARKAEAFFSLKGILLESQYFCLFESFVVSVFFFSLEPAGQLHDRRVGCAFKR